MELKLTQIEKKDLLKAWAALSFAFAIAFGGGFRGLSMDITFLFSFLVAGLTVGVGFVAHEMSHKLLAQKYGCKAEFRSFDQMLMLAILFSFFGFILAAPGGVFIRGHISKERHGKVSAAGIVANLVVAFLFFAIGSLVAVPIVQVIAAYGVMINSWLALFNLLPFAMFDGRKVLAWNKVAYGLMIAGAFAMLFLSSIVAS
jgi:Zn-dependent protease